MGVEVGEYRVKVWSLLRGVDRVGRWAGGEPSTFLSVLPRQPGTATTIYNSVSQSVDRHAKVGRQALGSGSLKFVGKLTFFFQ